MSPKHAAATASVVSNSVQPHRRQPNRLLCPWDSPGKNTGVGCHFLLQCMKVKSESEVAQLCPTLSNPMDCSLPGSSVHGTFQARVLVGCHCLLLKCRRPWFNSWVGKIPWRKDRLHIPVFLDFPGGSIGKESTCSVGDLGLFLELGRSPGEGHGDSLQDSCLKYPNGQRNLMDCRP